MKHLLILMVLVLSGCGGANRLEAGLTGWSKVCVDGVSYLQFTSGATVQVTPDGKPVGCSK